MFFEIRFAFIVEELSDLSFSLFLPHSALSPHAAPPPARPLYQWCPCLLLLRPHVPEDAADRWATQWPLTAATDRWIWAEPTRWLPAATAAATMAAMVVVDTESRPSYRSFLVPTVSPLLPIISLNFSSSFIPTIPSKSIPFPRLSMFLLLLLLFFFFFFFSLRAGLVYFLLFLSLPPSPLNSSSPHHLFSITSLPSHLQPYLLTPHSTPSVTSISFCLSNCPTSISSILLLHLLFFNFLETFPSLQLHNFCCRLTAATVSIVDFYFYHLLFYYSITQVLKSYHLLSFPFSKPLPPHLLNLNFLNCQHFCRSKQNCQTQPPNCLLSPPPFNPHILHLITPNPNCTIISSFIITIFIYSLRLPISNVLFYCMFFLSLPMLSPFFMFCSLPFLFLK